MSKRLAAFSLVELVVAMAIAGTVLLIGYQLLMIVTQYYHKYENLSESIQTSRSSLSTVYYDFSRAEQIVNYDDAIQFIDKNQKTNYYNFYDAVIRIRGSKSDTFPDLNLSFLDNTLSIIHQGEHSFILVKPISVQQKINQLEI